MSRRLPQTSARLCLFSHSFSLLPLPPVSLPLLLVGLFDSRRLHLSFSRTMAVIPLSPVTQKPPEGDGNDVPPIRIITNQTIGRGTLESPLSSSTCTAISSWKPHRYAYPLFSDQLTRSLINSVGLVTHSYYKIKLKQYYRRIMLYIHKNFTAWLWM